MSHHAKVSSFIKSCVSCFCADKKAVTAIEYGLIAALVAVTIIGGLATIGITLSTVFTTISASL